MYTAKDLNAYRYFREELSDIPISAVIDPLTGLVSRAYILAFIKDLISSRIPFALGIVDLDNFKSFNDNYGHDHGNEYLIGSLELIQDIFRDCGIFRIGGDEFVVVLTGENFAVRKELTSLMNATFERISGSRWLAPWRRFSAAIGMAEYEAGNDTSAEDVFKRADKMMYDNKVAMKAARE